MQMMRDQRDHTKRVIELHNRYNRYWGALGAALSTAGLYGWYQKQKRSAELAEKRAEGPE